MVGIKDIAEVAKISITTASIVLNGKGDAMRISKKTQKRVLEVAAELGYRPNIFAKTLRNKNQNQVPLISILWTLDARTSLVSRFMSGIQDSKTYKFNDFDILIQPYKNNYIHKVESLVSGNRFNGAIIANASNKDIEYLESSKLNVPVVLYQRNSEILNSVNVDNLRTGTEVARLFLERDHEHVALIIPDVSSQAVDDRLTGFKTEAERCALGLPQKNLFYNDSSEEGGYLAAIQLMKLETIPTAVFCLSDEMATGALAAFYKQGVKVPKDIELIGHDNNIQTKFTVPALSTVHLPVEEMARKSIQILLDILRYKETGPISSSFQPSFIFRKSCGGFSENTHKNMIEKG